MAFLSAFVVFCTTYALILPAITLENQELHTHSEACYDENGALICGLSETDTKRLMGYASETGNGRVIITVSKGGLVVQPDPVSGEYEIFAGKTYNVDVAYNGLKIDPGKYYVTFTSVANISLDQRGTLLLEANTGEMADVGSWYFQENEDGTVWLIFDINDRIQSFSHIDLVADVVCQFDYIDKPLEFDGIIKVNLKYNENTSKTVVNKWARSTQDQPGKIKWGTEIYGNSQSEITGNLLMDTISGGNHYYTEDDMERGIAFEATWYDGNFDDPNNRGESHTWTVTKDTPGLTWTEDGWNYIMPEKVQCTKCKKEITLGNDNWLYYFAYTSTMGESDKDYGNKASIDGSEDTGILGAVPSESTGVIVKTAEYKNNGTDKSDDEIEWTIKTTIFGKQKGEYDYYWHLWDAMTVDVAKRSDPLHNGLDQAAVTAAINGESFPVPEISKATADDRICWECSWTETSEGGVASKREIALYSRCNCTEDTCSRWMDGKCQDKEENGFCHCWCFKDDVELTFIYRTEVGTLVEDYTDQGTQVSNNVQLNNVYFPNGVKKSRNIDSSGARVPLSGVFSKGLTDLPDGDNDYKAEYTITVNEMMEDLAPLQSLVIDDTMTSTLAFLPDTMKIYKEDAKGIKEQVPSEQYTLSYRPNEKNEETGELENLLKITLQAEALGPYKYTLVYQAGVSGGNAHYTYSNKASIKLSGQTYDVGGTEYRVPAAAISGQSYGATVYKFDSDTGLPLRGAEFGLYKVIDGQEDGELLHTYTTDSSGIVQVETNTQEGVGVFLETHVLYYLKEEKAPDGYQLDDTKHYFWFCDNEDSDSCSKSAEFGGSQYNGQCIYTFETNPTIYDIRISNKSISNAYELPETGGPGTTILYIGALLIMISAAIILYKNQKRKE